MKLQTPLSNDHGHWGKIIHLKHIDRPLCVYDERTEMSKIEIITGRNT